MSLLIYGGVVLQHTKLLSHEKVAEMVGPNLARVRHTVRVSGIFNPALTSYAIGADSYRPVFEEGFEAPDTEVAVQTALLRLRRPFGFVAGDTLVIWGPKPVSVRGTVTTPITPDPGVGLPFLFAAGGEALGVGALLGLIGVGGAVSAVSADVRAVVRRRVGAVDAFNGPIPGPVVVTQNIGDKTFFVDFTVTTWVNDAPLRPVTGKTAAQYPQSPLLAQEFTVTHTVDQDFFCTRWVEGRAVFRSDVMQALKLFPDQLRYWLGHPVPNRFRRERIEVRQLSDGVTLEYRFADRERILNYDPNMFTRVEVVFGADTENMGLESTVRTGVGAALSTFLGIRGSSTSIGLMSGRFGDHLRRSPGGASFLAGLGSAAFAGLPVATFSLIGRFWGHAQQNRGYLETAAAQTLAALLASNGAAGVAGAAGVLTLPPTFTVGGFSIGGTRPGGPVRGDFLGLSVQLGDTSNKTRSDWSGMYCEIETHWAGSRLQSLLNRFRPGRAGAAPPVSPVRAILQDPMRGTYLGAAVASALRDSADAWTQTADPPNVDDTEVVRRTSSVSGLGVGASAGLDLSVNNAPGVTLP